MRENFRKTSNWLSGQVGLAPTFFIAPTLLNIYIYFHPLKPLIEGLRFAWITTAWLLKYRQICVRGEHYLYILHSLARSLLKGEFFKLRIVICVFLSRLSLIYVYEFWYVKVLSCLLRCMALASICLCVSCALGFAIINNALKVLFFCAPSASNLHCRC